MGKIKVFLCILLTVVLIMPVCNAFTDMDSNHWAYETVNFMTEKGILSGFTDGSFRPDDYISREQFATILSKTVEYANIELPINTENSWTFNDCVDVDNSRWSYKYIQKAFNVMGKSEGKNNGCYFEPDALMSREEVAKIMVNAKGLGKEEPDYSLLNKFSDKTGIDGSYQKYVAIAVRNGIMSGNANGTFDPKKNLTRAQIASLMSKLLDNGKNSKVDVISQKYVKIYEFSDGLAKVENNKGKYGYINEKGEEVIPPIYDAIIYDWISSDSLLGVMKEGKYGYINKEGKEVIPCIYDDIGALAEGLVRIKSNGEWGYIDKNGNQVIPFIYDDAGDFSDGLASAKSNGKYGYIDKEGNEVIPFIYDDAWGFSEGLANVKSNDKWGYIDKNENKIIPFIYDDTSYFWEGKSEAKKDGKWGLIDKNGNEVVPFIYDEFWDVPR